MFYQIDHSTLKALCSQHAITPITYFRCQNTVAVVRYNTKEEATNAKNKLNLLVLGNSTLCTQFISETDVKYVFVSIMNKIRLIKC
jgi:trinucleotide repeat-containing gene 6 protein